MSTEIYGECISCRSPLPPFTHKCPNCNTEQFSATPCTWCFRPIPQSCAMTTCPHCNCSQTLFPTMRQCVLCDIWLQLGTTWCDHCRTPQNYEHLLTSSFKRCCNSNCYRPMIIDLDKCPFCDAPQSMHDSTIVRLEFGDIRWPNTYLIDFLKRLYDAYKSQAMSQPAASPVRPQQPLPSIQQWPMQPSQTFAAQPSRTQLPVPIQQPPPPPQWPHIWPAQPHSMVSAPPGIQQPPPPPPPDTQPSSLQWPQPTQSDSVVTSHTCMMQQRPSPQPQVTQSFPQDRSVHALKRKFEPDPETVIDMEPSCAGPSKKNNRLLNTKSYQQEQQEEGNQRMIQQRPSPQPQVAQSFPQDRSVHPLKRKLEPDPETVIDIEPSYAGPSKKKNSLLNAKSQQEQLEEGNQQERHEIKLSIQETAVKREELTAEESQMDQDPSAEGTNNLNQTTADNLDQTTTTSNRGNVDTSIANGSGNTAADGISNLDQTTLEDSDGTKPGVSEDSNIEDKIEPVIQSEIKPEALSEGGTDNPEDAVETQSGLKPKEGQVDNANIKNEQDGTVPETETNTENIEVIEKDDLVILLKTSPDSQDHGTIANEDEKPHTSPETESQNQSEMSSSNSKIAESDNKTQLGVQPDSGKTNVNVNDKKNESDTTGQPVTANDHPLQEGLSEQSSNTNSQQEVTPPIRKEDEQKVTPSTDKQEAKSPEANAEKQATPPKEESLGSPKKPSMTPGSQEKSSKGNKSSGAKSKLLLPRNGGQLPNGFCADPKADDQMLIVFHALVHKEAWGWDDSSRVYMRFAGKQFGDFGYDYGPGAIERSQVEDFVCIKFHCLLKHSVLKYRSVANSLTYKYTVYTSKVTKENQMYEFLHETQDGHTNRQIIIPAGRRQPKGKMVHFDTIIYPSIGEHNRTWYSRLLKSSVKSCEQFKTDEEEMSHTCLNMFLSPFKKAILTGNSEEETFSLSDFAEKAVDVFNCLYTRRYHAIFKDGSRQFLKLFDSVKKDSIEWISNFIVELDANQSKIGPKQLLCGATYVLMIYNKMQLVFRSTRDVDKDILMMLFRMIGSLHCNYSSELVSIASNESKMPITLQVFEDEFRNIVKRFSTAGGLAVQDVIILLKFLPSIHSLKDDYKSDGQALEYSNVVDKNLSMVTLRNMMNKLDSGSILTIISPQLEPYLKLDPLLSLNLIYLCPVNDIPLLCNFVELNLVIDAIAQSMDNTTSRVTRSSSASYEVGSWIFNSFLVIRERFLQDADRNVQVYGKAFGRLGDVLHNRLLLSDNNKKALCLFCLMYLTFCVQNKLEAVKYRKDLCDVIQSWLGKRDVIGSNIFGVRNSYYQSSFSKLTEELQVWNFFLNNKTVKDALESTPLMKEEWNAVISDVLESRIRNVSEDNLVNLLLEVEKHTNRDDFVMNFLMSRTSAVLEQLFLKDQNSFISYIGFSSKSTKIAQLIGKLLTKRYPDFNESKGISLDDLLDWNLWPGFLKLHGSFSKLSRESKESWELICTSAMSQLQFTCDRMTSGQISMSEVRLLKEKSGQVAALCDASLSKGLLDRKKMQQLIALRGGEYDHFIQFKAKLFHFLQCLKCVPVKEINYLLQMCDRSNENDPINTLCIKEKTVYKIVAYSEATPLFSHVEDFHSLTKCHPSILFDHFWNTRIHYVCSSSSTITFDQIVTSVWNPVLQVIDSFIASLKSAEIEIAVLDQKLEELYAKDLRKLQQDLNTISTALSLCRHGTAASDVSWVDKVVSHINDYWRLCTYCEPALIFLKFRADLKLTGDFSIVEKISKGVEDAEYLCDIDPSIVEAGSFLQAFANDKRKQECLQAFVDCPKIVNWIRTLGKKETGSKKVSVKSNVNDLQNFVNIALATAAGGEGDLNTAKLINLRIIGSGFGPLIYNLPQTANYDVLQNHCKTLWATLEQTRDLPTIMRSCEDLIDWYSSVRETQGSVEKTSFGQMRNINKLGVYEVGSIRIGQLSSRSEAVCVRLRKPKGEKESLPQYKYTFEELRDLESKLVLITGNESPERKDVDKFLDTFHCVCRIADVLMQLQHYGNTHYIQWCLKFSCSMTNVYDLLAYQAKKMETDLASWLKEVKDERDKFYELNYFTTPQLLVLSEELGLFEASDDRKIKIKPSVMNLLYSISKDLNSKVVRDSLSQADLSQKLDVDKPVVTDISLLNVNTTVTADSSLVKENKPETKSVTKAKEPIPDEAPADYPKPSLTLEDLTIDQLSHFYNIRGSFEYHTYLILLGFERCAASSTMMEDVTTWCEEHEFDFEFPEEEEDNFDSSSDMSSESDTENDNKAGNTTEDMIELPEEPMPSSIATATSTDQPPVIVLREDKNITAQQEGDESSKICSSFEEMIETISQVPLDKNHPLVKVLMELDFELEASIEAVQKFPNNISYAIHYLERSSIEDSPSATKEEKGRFEVEAEVVKLEKMRIEVLDVTNRNYMSLSKLGKLLQYFAKNDAVVSKTRSLPETIKPSECNLVVVPPEFVLKTTLSIYMEPSSDSCVGRLPLPTHEEVLICTEKTTPEEVTLLWKRAFDDPGNKRIFCLVHAELLNYQVCDSALRDLQQLSQDKKGYKIVIICSNEEEEKSNIIAKLQSYRRPYQGIKADKSFLQYLMPYYVQHNISEDGVSLVDIERSRVRILSSARAGMGKSFYVQKMAETLCQDGTEDDCYRVVPIHGPRVDADSLVKAFDAYLKYDTPDPCIYHIDVSQTVLRLMDTLLFNLLILQTVCDSKGRVWRVNSKDLYAIEVTIPQEEDIQEICRSTVDFIKILPSIECKTPLQVLEIYSNESDEEEFSKPAFQRVYQYLRRNDEQANLDEYSYSLEEAELLGTHHSSDCLQLLLDKFSVKDPSWSELRHFISFLNEQLECSENSVFCNSELVRDIGLAGFKTFVVKFMIIMSKDFCTSSLKGEVAAETGKDTRNIGTMEKHEISEEKKWHRNYHPYLFFNKDGYSITFVGFNVVKWTGDVIDPVKNEVIMERAIKRDLYDGLENNRVKFDENYYEWSKDTMVEKIGTVMGIVDPDDPDPTYVLTPDNVIKILAIQMKFRCNIPVVIMGETGCGKTRLIRYMCDLAAQGGSRMEKVTNMLIMKVHGGITPTDITKMVLKAEDKAESNKREYGIDTVLFFDEANTTDAIGLIKEVMCDRRLNGHPLSSDLKFIAACNPYRKHHKDMISKLESAGLGFYVKATEAQEKLGEIPLRQLVYRVFDLPPSMRPLIYDFGKLDDETENKYTQQMVKDRCCTIEELASRGDVIEAVSHILTWSQSYMKKRTDECSFVSLRDVERALIVFKYFFIKRDLFIKLIKEKAGSTKCVSQVTWALIISLSVCYHARLQDRENYEKDVVEQFNLTQPLQEMEDGTNITLTQQQFQNELKWCQDVLLDHMTLGANIARNAALKENVFMMAICVQLKIPLFLVGKPGSSKSLAKSIIADSMNQQAQGFLKDFNEVHMFSYQCSQLSTPESVIEVFTTARKFQEDQKNTKFTSVVVLDEVGLAEDSPNLPLKALHPLLEDGTEGTEDQQIIAREKRVAFIGISNWALDPAKMNRGVMVTRADPNCDELILSAEQICASDKRLSKDSITKSTDEVDALQALLKPYFSCLSKAYTEICETQITIKRSFFGLRDFYSLIKMLFFMCKETKCKPSDKQLEHAIKRNFGGFDSHRLDTYQIFKKHLRRIDLSVASNPALNLLDDELMNPDCSPLGLIEKSLQTKTDELSQMGESRYLLFLTENYAALQVLQYKLREAVGIMKQEDSVADMEISTVLSGFGLEESSVAEKSVKPTTQRKKEPFVLFGSSFPKDREYTQVCRNINQIKICMETGRTVILLNLENLYESLYDLLNQYYILLGNSRYVDLGLQTHRVKCRVDNDFKLILIAERETVYKTFPTPLINRLEKHFVLTETILLDWQKEVLKKLRQWIDKFSHVKSYSSFKMEDAIVGYQHDTPAAVIFQVTKLKKDEWGMPNDSDLANYGNEIQESSRDLLLQMASPDALIRLKLTNLEKEQEELCRIYFEEQKHNCLMDFVKHQLLTTGDSSVSIQITTHSHLLSSLEIEEVYKTLGFTKQQTAFFLLQEFDTELDFTKALDPVFSESQHHQRLLIIQCDSGHLYGDLIASARYRIDDQREKAYRLGEHKTGHTHVLLIVHLPRYAKAPRHDHSRKNFSFVGFQGGAWTSAHIDDIHVTSSSGITLNDAMSASISELFYNMPFNAPELIDPAETCEAYCSLVEAFTAEEKKERNGEEMENTPNRDDDEEDMQLEEETPVIRPEKRVLLPPLQPPEKWAEKLPPQLEEGLPGGQAEKPLQDQGIPEEELMKELPDEQHDRESEEEGELDEGEFQLSNEMMVEEHEDENDGPREDADDEEEPMDMYTEEMMSKLMGLSLNCLTLHLEITRWIVPECNNWLWKILKDQTMNLVKYPSLLWTWEGPITKEI